MKNGFFDLAEAALKFEVFGENMKFANEAILAEWAVTVRDRAKAAIGTYKYKWPRLGPAAVARHGDTPLLETGELRDSISGFVEMYSQESGRAVVGSPSEIAVYQELGTRSIPPRSFLYASALRTEKDIPMIARKFIREAWLSAGHGNGIIELLHAVKLALEVAKKISHTIGKQVNENR